MAKKIDDRTKLRKQFDNNGYGLLAYADAHGFCRTRLGNILNGKIKLFTHEIMEIYKQLKVNGIYTDELFPWEKPKKSA